MACINNYRPSPVSNTFYEANNNSADFRHVPKHLQWFTSNQFVGHFHFSHQRLLFLHLLESKCGRQNMLSDMFFDIVKTKFRFHFQGQEKTNRLDEPEWFFFFLIDKTKELYGPLKLYEQIKGETDTECEDFIDKICTLVKEKVDEIINSCSKQKQQVVLNLAKKLILFDNALKDSSKHLSHGILFIDLKSRLVNLQNLKEKLQKMLSKNYTDWHADFLSIFTEGTCFCSCFVVISGGIFEDVFMTLLKDYVLAVKTFLDELCYQNNDDVKALCFFVSKKDDLEAQILETEEELALGGVCQVFDTKCISDLKHTSLGILCTIVKSGISRSLKTFRNFLRATKRDIVSSVLDITTVIGEYETAQRKNIHQSPEACY